MSTFGLQPTDLPVPCQTFQCYGRAAYFLGRSDAPAGTTQLVCVQCAQELKDQIFKEFIDSAAKEPVEELPFADIEPTELPEVVDFDKLTVSELKQYCKEIGIKGYSDKNREELMDLIYKEADHE